MFEEIREAAVINARLAFRRIPRSVSRQLSPDDLIQEGWIIALRSTEKYNAMRSRFRTFIGKKIEWGLREFFRAFFHLRCKNRPEFEPIASRDFRDNRPADLCFLNVEKLLGVLDDSERELIRKVYWHDTKLVSLGDGLRLSLPQVYELHSKALNKLRRKIERTGGI